VFATPVALAASILAVRRASDRVFAKVALVLAALEMAAVLSFVAFGLYVWRRYYA